MEAVDDSIFSDNLDVINSVAFEKLVRRAYGLERAYENCWKIEDWRRPDGKKNWTSKVQWDLCGDVVNTAARMCSYSKPGHVHVSEATYGFVQDTFAAVCRGEREIKGKGKMRTYFVLPLPANQNEILLTHCPPGLAPPPKAPDASFTA